MTAPIRMEHILEPVTGQTRLEVIEAYRTPRAQNPEGELLLPAGAKIVLVTWTGPEGVRLTGTNYWTSAGSRFMTVGEIAPGTAGVSRSFMWRIGPEDRHYLRANLFAPPSVATVENRHRLSVEVLQLPNG